MSTNKDICVMVVSCDAYSDAWSTFEKCFKRYWHDCELPCYLVSNEKQSSIEQFITITTGPEISWSRKVRSALNEIEEEYVFFLLEDYFFTDNVDGEKIIEDLNFLRKHNSGYLSYFPVKGMTKTEREGISLITENNIYGKVLQPSIWKKDYLRSCLYDDDFSAWEFENRQKINSNLRIQGEDYCTNYFPIKWKNGILQGKWFGPTVKYLKGLGITIDTSSRKMLPFSATLKYQYKSKMFGVLPVSLIRRTRKLAERFGVKFVTSE